MLLTRFHNDIELVYSESELLLGKPLCRPSRCVDKFNDIIYNTLPKSELVTISKFVILRFVIDYLYVDSNVRLPCCLWCNLAELLYSSFKEEDGMVVWF